MWHDVNLRDTTNSLNMAWWDNTLPQNMSLNQVQAEINSDIDWIGRAIYQIFGQLMSQKVKNLHIINKFQYTFSTTFVPNQTHTICMEIVTKIAGLWAAWWWGQLCQFASVLNVNGTSLWQFPKVWDSRHVTNCLWLSSCQPWCLLMWLFDFFLH